MKKKRTRTVDHGPSKQSLREIPEVAFSRGIRPHRYARLQTGYKNPVFVDPEVFEFFGSSDAINEALRFLVQAAARGTSRPRSKTRQAVQLDSPRRVFPCRAQRGRAKRCQSFSHNLSRPREHGFGEDRRRAGEAEHLRVNV